MRLKIYNALVNRVPGIAYRYHRVHDRAHGLRAVLSWVYLLLLNVGYYVLFLRFLGKKPEVLRKENRPLPIRMSESEADAARFPDRTPEKFTEALSRYDVISFDVFDTLLLRPFEKPTDLFFFLDDALGILDFHRIRMEMEYAARQKHYAAHGNYEVSFREIWETIEREVGPSTERGMKLEEELELRFCYANPFMLPVFRELKNRGKKIVLTTDMYLPAAFLEKLLEHCGYSGYDALYVSCESGRSKNVGDLYDQIREEQGRELRIVHVGDSVQSDVRNAKAHGIDSLYYPNVNRFSRDYRTQDMSVLVGGAYRGIVNNRLYSGLACMSMEYEYGFVYGGLFVVGYCSFIHDYCQEHGIEKLLFLSRDGDILKQVYDRMFPGEDTAYVLWGRLPATVLMADRNRYDYFRRFLWHKTGEGKTAEQLLREARLSPLVKKLGDGKQQLRPETRITADNAGALKDWLLGNWDDVLQCYEEEGTAARAVFSELLKGCGSAAAIDIGWAGSGAVSLACLTEQVWRLPCRVTGILAGTNTIHNVEPDASEGMLQSGRLVSYLYSQRENRDLWKKHDLNRDYNIYWELLLASPTPPFLGYGWDEDGRPCPRFSRPEQNREGVIEIQRGIRDFAEAYLRYFGDRPEMLRISGRDAYAPMLTAAGRSERYLKEVNRRFSLQVSVGAAD